VAKQAPWEADLLLLRRHALKYLFQGPTLTRRVGFRSFVLLPLLSFAYPHIFTSETMGNHALIYGASGISGWAIVNAILDGYPSKDAFSKVTAMVNRPLTRGMALWSDDPRLQIVSGVDLVKGTQEELEKQIKDKVEDFESVTQVYFYCECSSAAYWTVSNRYQRTNSQTTRSMNAKSTKTC
jgi:hypothetical protein